MMWRKRQTRAKLAPNVHHNEQNPSDLVNILTNLSIKSEQKHDTLSNSLDLLHEENVRLGLYEGVYDLSIKSDNLSIKSDNLSIKSEKAMREVQRLGQEIEIEYVLKVEDDDDIQEYKKHWVGLTDKEIDALESATDTLEFPQTARAIEAKLKEKNS